VPFILLWGGRQGKKAQNERRGLASSIGRSECVAKSFGYSEQLSAVAEWKLVTRLGRVAQVIFEAEFVIGRQRELIVVQIELVREFSRSHPLLHAVAISDRILGPRHLSGLMPPLISVERCTEKKNRETGSGLLERLEIASFAFE
jgi:hypothetical protein